MRMTPIMGEFRLGYDFREVVLSVVGGEYFYSLPRVALAELEEYQAVELGFLLNGELSRPSDYDDSLKPWDHYFEPGSMPIAAYMPVADFKSLRDKVEAIVVAADAHSDAHDEALRDRDSDVTGYYSDVPHFDTGAAGRDVCPKHGTELDPFGACLRCETE
jgi:hypothetical protein